MAQIHESNEIPGGEDEGKVDSSFLDSNYSSVTPVDIAITRDCWKTYRAEKKINNWEMFN